MGTESFSQFLSGLDGAALTALLRARPDTCVEPVPRDIERLAQRLNGLDSLGAALRRLDHDQLVVGQAVAALGEAASTENVARLLDASPTVVAERLDELCARGLSWPGVTRTHLPEALEAAWRAQIGGGRSVTAIAGQIPVDDLRAAAKALGAPGGARKADVVAGLGEAMADPRALAGMVAGLPEPLRRRLDELRRGHAEAFLMFGSRSRGTDPDEPLVEAGLLFRTHYRLEMPSEVAVATWLSGRDLTLTGAPELPAAGVDADSLGRAAEASAQECLRGMTTLLDDAASSPIPMLKKGGVGRRERSRLVKRLALPGDETLVTLIDLAHAAGLLGATDSDYVPTATYTTWREDDAARRWAKLAHAWFELEHAPTYRKIDEDKELAPPLPLASAAGMIRRSLLAAAVPHRSVRAAGEAVDWFCPLHGYHPEDRRERVEAALREARMLGVIGSDAVSELGEQLVTAVDAAPADVIDELARRSAALLADAPCEVILQSDLTAVVSGHPSAAVSRVLAAAAEAETRGAAGIWRFTPGSVRVALDAGWTPDGLLAKLREISARPLPQPLEYLVGDVARRHGQVRVRGMRACVVAEESLVEEILYTRKLGTLQLARVAPTVLSSPSDLDEVLGRLRAAGFLPMPEDALGVVIVEQRDEQRAPSEPAAGRGEARVPAADLAARLRTAPVDPPSTQLSTSARALARFNRQLDEAELELLADAVDGNDDIRITYLDNNGNRTVRDVRPELLCGGSLDAWCYQRDDEREFSVARIEAVGPPR